MRLLRTIALELGKGLMAGLAGTIAMTLSSTLEQKLRRRPPSSTPADAMGKVLGMQPRDEAGKRRFATAAHFGYGTMWGLGRAVIGRVLGAARLTDARVPALAHFAAVWGTELLTLPRLEVVPPLRRWGAKALALDAFHHGVYVSFTDLAYRALDRA
jgi:hypothetical protein